MIIHLLLANVYHFAEMFSNRKPLWCRSSFSFSIVILFDPCCFVFSESIPLMLKEGKWISVKLSSSQRKKWGIVSCIKVSILSFGSEQKQYICFPHKTHMWTYWNSFWLFFAQQCASNEKSFGAFHNRLFLFITNLGIRYCRNLSFLSFIDCEPFYRMHREYVKINFRP